MALITLIIGVSATTTYLEVHGTYQPMITVLKTVLMTLLGHLRGL